jgi:hypothetical protein
MGGFRKTLDGTTQRLSSTTLYVTEFEIYSLSTNAGNYYLGDENVSATDNIPREPGSYRTLLSEDIGMESRHFDLNQVFVLGTNNDVIVVEYRKNTANG